MCVYCVQNVSTVSTYIAFNVLEILMTCINSVDIYSIEWHGWKALSLSFLNFFPIENQLNIKEVMIVYTVLCNNHKHQCLCVNSVDK